MGQPANEEIYEGTKESVEVITIDEKVKTKEEVIVDPEEAELFQYIRDENKKPIGVMFAKLVTFKVPKHENKSAIIISMSTCNSRDKWDRNIGKSIAKGRFNSFLKSGTSLYYREVANAENRIDRAIILINKASFLDNEYYNNEFDKFHNRASRYFAKVIA